MHAAQYTSYTMGPKPVRIIHGRIEAAREAAHEYLTSHPDKRVMCEQIDRRNDHATFEIE